MGPNIHGLANVSHNSLHWRHNDLDGVSNHQLHGCLLNRLFRRRSKKTSKLCVTGLCVGNSPGPVNSPQKGPITRKMFSFDDILMFSSVLDKLALLLWHAWWLIITWPDFTQINPLSMHMNWNISLVIRWQWRPMDPRGSWNNNGNYHTSVQNDSIHWNQLQTFSLCDRVILDHKWLFVGVLAIFCTTYRGRNRMADSFADIGLMYIFV